MPERIKILNIPFDNVTLESALQKVEEFIETTGQYHIATPNPEMLLEAEKNDFFRKILEQTALNIPDGIGIIFASRWLCMRGLTKGSLQKRTTGTDLVRKIVEKSIDPTSPLYEKKIFLLGAQPGVAEKVKEKLTEKYGKIVIVGMLSGTPLPQDEKKICDTINNSGAEILFVAYGAPAQELWIARNFTKMPKVHIAVGVGGAFDFLAEIRKRAPVWMQQFGLEWLYRLIQEPHRFKRIYHAVIEFPIVVLKNH